MNLSEESQPLRRSGLQSLYTFTPFKLISGRDEYKIILVPLCHYYTKPDDLEWNRGIEDSFLPRTKTECISDVLTPSVINVQVFKEKQHRSFSFEYYNKHYYVKKQDKILMDKNKKITSETAQEPFPIFFNYSFESLRQGYYCKFGLVLLNDGASCPLEGRCELFERNNKGNCKYYEGPRPYESLYNVYPHIIRVITELPPSGQKRPIKRLIVIDVDGTKRVLGKIEFHEQLSLEAYADASIFYDKRADLIDKDFLWVSYKEGIGFKIDNLPGLVFKFNYDTLKEFISNIISNDKEIHNWLCLKMLAYFGTEKEIRLRKYSMTKKGFIAQKRLQGWVADPSQIKSDACDIEKLSKFGSFVLIHTLAHTIITTVLASMTAMGSPDDITYYIQHPIFGDSSASLYIVESIYGGLGYLKALGSMILSKDRRFLDILLTLSEIYNRHEKEINGLVNDVQRIYMRFSGRIDKEVLDEVKEIFKAWKSGPLPHAFPNHLAIRAHLSHKYKKVISLGDSTRQAFKELISELPLCWDGCNMCVGMEKGCMFGPYDQPFFISRKLVTKFLETAEQWIKEETFAISSAEQKNLDKVFLDLIGLAESSIKVATPWISKEVVDALVKMKEKGVSVKIACLDDETNKVAIQEAERNGIEVIRIPKSDEELMHAKLLIIDDSIALSGSSNFTQSGLKRNIELDTLTINPKQVEEHLKLFNEIEKKYSTKSS